MKFLPLTLRKQYLGARARTAAPAAAGLKRYGKGGKGTSKLWACEAAMMRQLHVEMDMVSSFIRSQRSARIPIGTRATAYRA